MSAEPKRPGYEETLERRARALAEVAAAAEEGAAFAMIAVLAVGDARLGVPAESLAEVVRRPPVTPLPGLAPWFTGIAQIRGELVSVVHLGRWLGLRGAQTGPFFAVLDGERGPLALEIDAVEGFRTIREHELAPGLGDGLVRIPGLVAAATRDLTLILDPGALLSHRDIVAEPDAAGAGGPAPRPGDVRRTEEPWTTPQE